MSFLLRGERLERRMLVVCVDNYWMYLLRYYKKEMNSGEQAEMKGDREIQVSLFKHCCKVFKIGFFNPYKNLMKFY